MSSSLVRKSLAIVEQNKDFKQIKKKSASLKVPSNHKVHNFQGKTKLTIGEARKQLVNSQTKILKSNLKKLKKIRQIEKVQLDDRLKEKILQRAVTKRPVKSQKKLKVDQKSAFTEEDFKKFEAEYFE